MRYIAIFFYISRYAIYRDIFWSYRDTNVHGIYGRIDGGRRKYTRSHSADATSVQQMQLVLGHIHTFEFRCGAAGAAYIYTVIYPPPYASKSAKYLNV